MRIIALALFIGGLGLMGCQINGSPVDDSRKTATEATRAIDPATETYTQVREGLFQVGAISDELAEALLTAQGLVESAPATERDALEEVRDAVDTAGAGLADFETPPADRTTFDQAFAEWDDRRLKAITAANDAHVDLSQAIETLAALVDQRPSEARTELRSLLELIRDDLSEAIIALGGQLENDESTPEPTAD